MSFSFGKTKIQARKRDQPPMNAEKSKTAGQVAAAAAT